MNIKYKVLAASLVVVFAFPVVASAQTMSATQLLAEIQTLTTQLQALQQKVMAPHGGSTMSDPSPMWCHDFITNLAVGNGGSEVTALQSALQKNGEEVSITGTFDGKTASAVTDFQQKYASAILTPNGLQSGTGYVGKSTRAQLNSLFGCSNSSLTSPTSISAPIPTMTNQSSGMMSSTMSSTDISIPPIIQRITVTGTGLGKVNGRAKSISDWLGALNFRAGTGWVAINKVTVTLNGSMVTVGSSTFLDTVQLLDQNDNSVVTADGATVSVNVPAGTVTWTFPSGASGFTIPQYESYSFTLNVNSTSVPPEQGVAETLTAQVLNASDVQYSTASQTGLALPPSEVPVTINSVAYAVGS